jgi:hypothetical protein
MLVPRKNILFVYETIQGGILSVKTPFFENEAF